MRNLDFSSWQSLPLTLIGLLVVTLVGVGVRLLVMQHVQKRRERENRQINERLRTLIAAYKTLGGSFTGELSVDPAHLRDLRGSSLAEDGGADGAGLPSGSERARRIRDAVEGALSDILLLGTDEQVRLAARAATELAAGQSVHTAELVVSLRDFIRHALDLEPVPADLVIPRQGPTRPATAARGKAGGGREEGGRGGGGGGGGAGGAGGGAGMAAGGMGIRLGGDRDD